MGEPETRPKQAERKTPARMFRARFWNALAMRWRAASSRLRLRTRCKEKEETEQVSNVWRMDLPAENETRSAGGAHMCGGMDDDRKDGQRGDGIAKPHPVALKQIGRD
jgi:hypothetical protein